MALVGGFAAMLALVMGLSALVSRMVPGWAAAAGKPQLSYAVVTLGSSFLASAAGGYATAWAAASNPLILVLVLATVVLAMAALSALQSLGKQPVWLALAQVAISPVGVLAGGLVRMRVLGIL